MISYAQNLVEYFRFSRQFYYLILDLQGNYSYANPLFQETIGHHSPNTNISFTSALPNHSFNQAIGECLNNPSCQATAETSIKSVNGRRFTIKWEVSAIIDEEGKVENIQAIGVNNRTVTKGTQAKVILKGSEERFRQLISNLNFGVTMRDANGKALLCNKEALKFAELSEEEFLKTTLPVNTGTFIKEDGSGLPNDQHPTIVATKTKKPIRDVVLGVKKKQNCSWVLINAEPILDSDGNLLHVITTFIDITERKKLERKLISTEINKQKIITNATIEGQEKERKEIGKELHDNINQILTTTQLYLEIAKGTADANTLEMIQLSSKSVGNAINEIRKLSRSLTPPSLGDIGLVESIKDLCDSIKTTQIFDIRFYHKDFDEIGLSENLKLMLFRIIQEQINNIIKYAEATTILIRLITDTDQLTLVVSDNGKGFEPSATKRGLGFNNIINRAEIIHGNAEIRSAPEQGCTIIVTVPMCKI
jgi:PAS domain S-box-containing protein